MFNFWTNISVKAVLDSLSVNIAVLDDKGIIKYVNQAWIDFAHDNGLDPQECGVGADYLAVLDNVTGHLEECAKALKAAEGIKAVITGEKEEFVFEYACDSPQQKRWFEMKVTTFIGGHDRHVVVAHENITDRKKQEQELKTMKNFHNSILDNLEEVIVYLKPGFNLKWANQAAKKYFSLSLEEMKTQPCYSKFGLDEHCSNCPIIKSEQSKKREEAIVEKPDGSTWLIKAIPDCSSNGELKGIIEVALDITQRKRVERQMKQVVNRLEEQFEKAGQLHDQFLPNKMPQIAGLTLGTYYAPADRLGGDFYNFIELEDKLIFYVSDVSGHDLSGSMLNIFLKETINSYLIANNQTEDFINPVDIIEFINNHFNEEKFPDDYFICLIIGIIDVNTKEIKFSSAGMQFSPLLIKNDGISTFSCGGLPISNTSFDFGFEYQNCQFKLAEKEIFFLYTDGLIEQNNSSEMYGEERLQNLLKEDQDSNPNDIIEQINLDFNDFRDEMPMQDDVTYMLIQHDNN
ncbi:SpoIIE family protein phosphatase [Halanaerobacter jeridensis]|uniref:PAS domain S-box-containing protein n=1 Tax=Halanaerobacter jeridensis TaxID=706427 RepID=A0A938XWU7_9FIRM|nr:SpoIIE family protein phosphatase [Halanaerobacter jeridensis]MBM7556755.1 PAS domain S-box-containing protein [Halanaerobacter jeridensis]